MFLICRYYTVSPAKTETVVLIRIPASVIHVMLGKVFVYSHLLVMPPPGGRPGISSAARNLITYRRSGSSSLDLIAWMISVKFDTVVIDKGAIV